jgi:hypothetical protein
MRTSRDNRTTLICIFAARLGVRGLFEGRKIMPKFLLIVSAFAAVLALAAVQLASAANPQVIHFTFSGTNTDDNFCDTGMTVNDSYAGHVTVWLAPNQPVDSRNFSEINDVFTNPANGATVIIHSAYGFTDTLISGDPSGLNTHEWIFKGAGQVIRAAHGGVLSHDTGYLVVHTTWNGPEFFGEFVGSEIVFDRGPHPGMENGDHFCNVMVAALGLS